MHATDAGCNKCKKCGKSEKYEKCDNFVTSVKIVKSLKSMKSVTILKLCGIRHARRAACREFLGGSRFDPPSRGTKFSTISERVASFSAVL